MLSFITFLLLYDSHTVYPTVNDYHLVLEENSVVDYIIPVPNVTLILHDLQNCTVSVTYKSESYYPQHVLVSDAFFFGNHTGKISITSETNDAYINFSLIKIPSSCNILEMSTSNTTYVSFSPALSHFNESVNYCLISSPFEVSETKTFFASNPIDKTVASSIDYCPSLQQEKIMRQQTSLNIHEDNSRSIFIALHLSQDSLKHTHFLFTSQIANFNTDNSKYRKAIRSIIYNLTEELYINGSESTDKYTYYGKKPYYYFPPAAPVVTITPSFVGPEPGTDEDQQQENAALSKEKDADSLYKTFTIVLACISIVCIIVIFISVATVFWTRKVYKDKVCSVIMLDENSVYLSPVDITV